MKTTLKLILAYFAYQLLFGALMIGLANVWNLDATTQIICNLLLSGLAMTAHLIIRGHVNLRKALRPVEGDTLLCSMIMMAGAIIGCNALSCLIPLPNWLEGNFEALGQTFMGGVCIVLVAPWVEELLFRGAIMPKLNQQGKAPWRGITLSALLFGLIHVNPAQVLFAALMGLALGWATWCTRSLWPAIVGHVMNNALGVAEIVASSNGGYTSEMERLPAHTLIPVAVVGLLTTLIMGQQLASRTEFLQDTEN